MQINKQKRGFLSLFFFYPRFLSVKIIRDQCRQCPANGPCHPYACFSEAEALGEKEGESHTQEQVGKGAGHELQHGRTSAEHPVAHDLENNDEIEGRHDLQIIHPGLNGFCAIGFQKQSHGRFAAEEIEQEEGDADKYPKQRTCLPAFGPPFGFLCPQVLGCARGKAVGKGGHAGHAEYIQFLAGGESCYDCRAIAVDGRLHENVADGNKALLQNAGNGDNSHLLQHGQREFFVGFLGLQLLQTMNEREESQDTGSSLCRKGGPGDPCHTHVQPDDKNQIQNDIPDGRTNEEIQGRAAVPQRSEYAVTDVIQEGEQIAQYINFQINRGVRENISRCFDEGKHPVPCQKPQYSHDDAGGHTGDENRADDGFQFAVFPCTKKTGNHHCTADIAANGHRHEDHGDGMGSTNGSQGVFSDETTCDDAVYDMIHLLKCYTEQHGYGKHPEHFTGIALGKIGDHGKDSLT